jgi:hypothetical protein
LLEALVTHLKNVYHISKDKVKSAKMNFRYTKMVVELISERGKPEVSIVEEAELYLEKLNNNSLIPWW